MEIRGFGEKSCRVVPTTAPQLCFAEGLFLVAQDVINGLLNIGDLLGFVIRNLALELFFESHHEFYCIQRVCAEVVNKRRFILDIRFIDAELFCDYFSDALFDIFNLSAPSKVHL